MMTKYGFVLAKNHDNNVEEKQLSQMNRIVWEGYSVHYNPLPKFENDKLFYHNKDRLVLLDGVIFNKQDLIEKYHSIDWRTAFDAIYDEYGITCIDLLRGSFCGIIIDQRQKETLYAFSNHTGERPIYYHKDANGLCDLVASHVNFMEGFIKSKNEKLIPSIESAYMLLSTGSCLGNNTPFENIFRITAGKYIEANAIGVKELWYHMFRNVPEWEKSLDDLIEEGDKLFRQAEKRIYGKNQEYGYESECDLSGGLDSRMATYVAHELGYEAILNMCYCIEGNLDNIISKQIAHDLGNRYSFLNMDGNVLMDIDQNVDLVGGQVIYSVGTGSRRSLEQIDTSNLGMCCTGLLGELENAYWIEGNEHTPANYIRSSSRFSNFYPLKLSKEIHQPYENYEQENIYEHSLQLFISSTIIRQQITEVTSPFFDVDYIDFIFKVPLKYRMNYKYLTTWMMKKYPKAAEYVWQAKGIPVKNWVTGEKFDHNYLLDMTDFSKQKINGVFRKANIKFQFSRISDMNPTYTWYCKNKELRNYIDNYFNNNIAAVENKQLQIDLRNMFKKGTPMDKILVCNYLGINKRYFV